MVRFIKTRKGANQQIKILLFVQSARGNDRMLSLAFVTRGDTAGIQRIIEYDAARTDGI